MIIKINTCTGIMSNLDKGEYIRFIFSDSSRHLKVKGVGIKG